MKCIGRIYGWMLAAFVCAVFLSGCTKAEEVVATYETENYNKDIYRGELFTGNLCVVSEDVLTEGVLDPSTIHASALFDVDGNQVDFAYNVHERVYPASTTKIMTALLAIKYGDLSAVVTVSPNADAANFAADEKTCGIKAGDTLTLSELLHGLLMESGNDTAVAIAEYIAGSSDAFAGMMNEEAQNLMATNTHFINSNGLHDTEHYTTAYDLYLIFNECIKHQEFVDIIGTKQFTANITGADGVIRQANWSQTNLYATGQAELPTIATIIGGKTGTTKEAGNCLILLDKDSNDRNYISIVMGADNRALLYQDMTSLINSIPVSEQQN